MTNETKHTAHNPAPWTANLAPLFKAGDKNMKVNGSTVMVDVRLLSEDNFQYAMRCVNAHDDLVGALEAFLTYGENEATLQAARAALKKASE